MPTPARTIERIPAQRLVELPELEKALELGMEKIKLARLYAGEGDDRLAADRLEGARTTVAGVLEELNTFRAPAKRGAEAQPEPEATP